MTHRASLTFALISLFSGCATSHESSRLTYDYASDNGGRYEGDYASVQSESDNESLFGNMMDVAEEMMDDSDAPVSAPMSEPQGLVRRVASPMEPTPSVEKPDVPKNETLPENRRPGQYIIYTATLNMRVVNLEKSVDELAQLAAKNDAYLSHKRGNSFRYRVPVQNYQLFVDDIKRLGTVNGEDVSTDDVTDSVADIQLRIRTAKSSHARLVALLEKASNVKDTLHIEKELRRLTTEIERYEGQLRTLKDRARYSIVNIQLSRTGPSPKQARSQSPFPWIRAIGPRTAVHMPSYHESLAPFQSPLIDAPKAFLPVGLSTEQVRAISSSESILWARQFDTNGGDVAFWKKAVRKELSDERGLELLEEKDVSYNGAKGFLLTVPTEVLDSEFRYALAVIPMDGFWGPYVLTIEYVGELDNTEDLASFKKMFGQ